MKKSTTKRALLSSALSLLLCVAMLIGTTFAWFTDSVTSANNIIKSGNLDVTMEWKDATENGTQQTYKDASQGAIFNYDLWEPGYVEAKNVKISNVGTLALKYQLNIIANGTVSELADVIDVYFAEGEYKLTDRKMDELTKVGTLTDVLKGMPANASGDLLKGESDTVTIALKMQESAGNEYQGKAIGTDFSVQLRATQMTYESDSFDNQYDADAPADKWDGIVPTEMPETLVVDTEKHLISINDAAAFAYLNTLVNSADFYTNYGSAWKYSIELNADIDLANKAWTPITLRNFVAFEGNGHTIKNLNVNGTADYAGLFAKITCNDNGHTEVSNFTLDGASVSGGLYTGAFAGEAIQAEFSNVNVINATVNGTKYVGGLAGRCSCSTTNCSVKNSTVTGSDKTVGGLIGYSVGDPGSITVKGNTVENVTVTGAYNVGGLLGAAQKETVEKNTVKNVKVISTTDLPADASSTERLTGEVVARNAGAATVEDNNVVNVTVAKGATVSDVAGLKAALTNGATVIDAQEKNIGALNYALSKTNVPAGKTVTIKNAVVEGKSYGNGVDGTVIFENCTFTRMDGAYSIHFDSGSGNVEFKNCSLDGWCSFGKAIKSVKMTDCDFKGNGIYAMIRFYQDVTLTNCTFDCSNANTEDNEYYPEGIDMAEGFTATVINCTNVNGDMEDLFEEADLQATDGKVIFE